MAHRPSVTAWHLVVAHVGFVHSFVIRISAFVIPPMVCLVLIQPGRGADVDLSEAVIVADQSKTIQYNAARLLRDEIQARTRLRLEIKRDVPTRDRAAIVLGAMGDAFVDGHPPPAALAVPAKADGYSVWVDLSRRQAATICLFGRDDRGVLYAAGRLLRHLLMQRDRLSLNDQFGVATAPRYPLRGHQLGYRPKTNSYDAWTVEMWEAYIRDLVVFGANAIELVPPRSDDDDDSRHFPLPQLEMMIEMSRLADAYGLDVWIWYPIIDDRMNAADVEQAIKERQLVFKSLPRLDVVFVPGGDPGEVHPEKLFPLMEKQYEVLHQYHPEAQIWVSPQGFDWAGYPMEKDAEVEGEGWLQLFYDILHRDRPTWLGGVVHGPQVTPSLKEFRAKVPPQYPIRRYPDITHTLDAQHWVHDWDPALYATLYREPINPRPHDYAKIFLEWDQYACGFITYSEGVNDDVNKCVWASLGWDPDTPLEDILQQYSRYYVSPRWEKRLTRGLLGLERNWKGPLLTNVGVYETLKIFQEMEQDATPTEKLNWRFQAALYRAYYDAYIRRRLIHETEIEEQTMDVLRRAPEIGSQLALQQAEAVLDRTVLEGVAPDWRRRVFELAEGLYQSIRLQLDVTKYEASDKRRGGNLEDLDEPVNNYANLKKEFVRIRRLESADARRAAIKVITSERLRMKQEFDDGVIQEGIN